MYCPFVESSSPIAVREPWLMVIPISEWIPIVQGAPQRSVLDHLLFILYTSEMFEMVEIRLCAYSEDSILLSVVRKPADRHAVSASLNRDLARFQEWCKHWGMAPNPNKIKSFVVSRSRTVIPPYVNFVLSGVSIRASPNLDILGLKLDREVTTEDHVRVRGIVSRVSQRIGF